MRCPDSREAPPNEGTKLTMVLLQASVSRRTISIASLVRTNVRASRVKDSAKQALSNNDHTILGAHIRLSATLCLGLCGQHPLLLSLKVGTVETHPLYLQRALLGVHAHLQRPSLGMGVSSDAFARCAHVCKDR